MNSRMSSTVYPEEWVGSDPVLSNIGDTPLRPLYDGSNLLLKMESYNPTGSAKDRIGVGMIQLLKDNGELDDGDHIVESSSGNTAGSVALAANRLGHECTIVAKDSVNPHKIGYVRALGGDVVFVDSDAPYGSEDNYQEYGKVVAEERDAVFLNQYESEFNPLVHEMWTGREIVEQLGDMDVGGFVASMGTGGTISGVARALKENYELQVVGVDAVESNIHREFNGDERATYHSEVEGLGQWRTTDSSDFSVIDDICTVPDEVAFDMCEYICEKYGQLIGPSSAAVVHVAQELEEKVDGHVVCMVHDGVEQYWDEVAS